MNRASSAVLTASLLVALVGTTHAAPAPITGHISLFDLDDLSTTTGFRIDGNDENDYAGFSVAPVGDVNADGFDDFAVAAPLANDQTGEVYIIFGRDDGLPSPTIPSALDGANGFYIQGVAPGDRTGNSVAGAGDVNGDKIPDIIVGVPSFDGDAGEDAGRAAVIFGRKTSAVGNFPAAVFINALDGTNGFRIEGEAIGDELGRSVAAAGDFNGDKIGDVIVGAPRGNTSAGKAYIVFGRKKNVAFPASFDVNALDGTDGTELTGVNADDAAATSIAGLGDVNGDKIGDIIIGAPYADRNGNDDSGAAYVVFGRKPTTASPIPGTFSLGDLDGFNGFVVEGFAEYDYCGSSVASAGDVNADKIPDIIVGAFSADPGAHTNAGEAYVIFGRKKTVPFAEAINPASLNGANGFRLATGTNLDNVGEFVAPAGDVNGDKIADFIVTAPDANTNGLTFVVFGRNTARDGNFAADVSLSNLDGIDGFTIQGNDDSFNAGTPSASAGDFNGDGLSDIIVAVPENTVGADDYSGQAFIIFGPRPEIMVSNIIADPTLLGATEIVDGSSANLGVQNVGQTRTYAVEITNLGLASLTVSNVKLPRGFALVSLTGEVVQPLDTETLTFSITPTRVGSFSGKVSFTTNDADEKKFDFILQWTGQEVTLAAQPQHAGVINVDTLPDLNNDWITNAADLLLMLQAIRAGDPEGTADLTDDDRTDASDLALLLANFGQSFR